MARHNLSFLFGFVLTAPTISTGSGGDSYALVYVTVGRGTREVGDHRKYMKCDEVPVMTVNPKLIDEISKWKPYDIVEIKGTVVSKNIKKSSFCKNCGTKHVATGSMVFVNPIDAKFRLRLETEEKCMRYLADNREFSNQAFVFGTLCRDPKKVSPKVGLTVTQYQMALNRKYRERNDPPELRTDYPWVKSYGENALEDRKRLHIGSVVFVDGCLQARSVNRHAKCEACGAAFDWKDRAMEIVPYETEYIKNFYSDEEVEENERAKRAAKTKDIKAYLAGFDNDLDDTDDANELSYD